MTKTSCAIVLVFAPVWLAAVLGIACDSTESSKALILPLRPRPLVSSEQGFSYPTTCFRWLRNSPSLPPLAIMGTMNSPDFPADTKGVVDSEVELLYCLGPKHCVSLTDIAAGHRIFKMLVARDSPFALLIRGPDPDRATVDVFQLPSGLRVGHFPVGAWIHAMHNQPIEWVGSRILARWGAGTCIAFATVYDVSGTTVATYTGRWIGLSPNRKYIAEAGAKSGGPCALTILNMYELKTGAKLHSKNYSSQIDDVLWHTERGEAIVLLQTPKVGLLRKEVVQLEI